MFFWFDNVPLLALPIAVRLFNSRILREGREVLLAVHLTEALYCWYFDILLYHFQTEKHAYDLFLGCEVVRLLFTIGL